jgi:hypothetical protein
MLNAASGSILDAIPRGDSSFEVAEGIATQLARPSTHL